MFNEYKTNLVEMRKDQYRCLLLPAVFSGRYHISLSLCGLPRIFLFEFFDESEKYVDARMLLDGKIYLC